MLPRQLCNREKFPAETLAGTENHSWPLQKPKVIPSADIEILTRRRLFIWAADPKFKGLLLKTYVDGLISLNVYY